MWSHYSDSHKGVCLTIEVPRDLVYSICYTSKRVLKNGDIDAIIAGAHKGKKKSLMKDYDSLSFSQKVALIKDRKWQYENEFRIVFDSSKGLIFENGKWYMPVKIKNIYLGVNFILDNPENQKTIQLCKKRGIKIKKMVLSKENYSLTPIEYKE